MLHAGQRIKPLLHHTIREAARSGSLFFFGVPRMDDQLAQGKKKSICLVVFKGLLFLVKVRNLKEGQGILLPD